MGPLLRFALGLALAAAGCTRPPPHAAPAPFRAEVALPGATLVRALDVAPGVRYLELRLDHGPWAVHLLSIDENVCRPRLEARHAGPPLERTATTTALAAGELAGLNADFFDLPRGTPVGAHVSADDVVAGPGARPVLAVTASGGYWMGTARLDGLVHAGPDSAALAQVNRPVAGGRHHPPQPGITLFTHWFGDSVPADVTTLRLRLLEEPQHAVVTAAVPPGGSAPLHTGSAAMQGTGSGAAWLARRAVGDTIIWSARLRPGDGAAGAAAAGAAAAREALGGFPLLVVDAAGVLHLQAGVLASFGDNRHPRTAFAWNERARWSLWIAVDGRQPPYSDGMSLAELQWLALRLGATHAINFDGGGSTALVVHGRLVNRPSDDAGERAVANALVLRGCD
jgi:hypothetical protein